VSAMPRKYQHRLEGVGRGVGIAVVSSAALASQQLAWKAHGVPTRADCPHTQLNICYFKGQILI
jgi:hypothetical protein